MRWAVVSLVLCGCRPTASAPTTPEPSPEPAEPEPAAAEPEPAAVEPEPESVEPESVEPHRVPLSTEDRVPLSKDTIRGVVRGNVTSIRQCYNDGLAKNPNLEGRVAVRFTIGPEGDVVEAVVAQTDLPDDSPTPECITTTVKRWRFPPPLGGGNAVITYPFLLQLPDDAPDDALDDDGSPGRRE